MDREVLVLSRVYDRLDKEEKQMDEEKSAQLRMNELKGEKVQTDDRAFESDLVTAGKGGLTREEESGIRDTYYRAEELPKETADQVKAMIHQDVKDAGKAYENGDPTAWDDVPSKAESSLRAGIMQETPKDSEMEEILRKNGITADEKEQSDMDPEKLTAMYKESEERMPLVRDQKDRRMLERLENREMTQEQARDIVTRNIKSLVGKVVSEQKPASVQLDGVKLTMDPTKLKDGRKAVSLLINGSPVSLKGAVDKIMYAVPGLREAKVAVKVVQKVYQSFKQVEKSIERGVEAR